MRSEGGGARPLVLTRPLVYFDLETTGVDPRNDRIVEVSLLKAFPPDADGSTPEPLVRTRRVNPGMPIPPGATAVHHITDADVADEPPFEKVAKSLFDLLQDCDFAGFGVRRYDLPLLAAEFKRADLDFDYRGRHVIDGKDIFHFKEPRTLSAAYALYCGGELKSAHSAEADMLASRDVILAQLERYEDLPTTVEELAAVGAPAADPDAFDSEGKLKWIAGEVVLNFGNSKGKTLRELSSGDRGLLNWILQKDFSDEVKTAVRNALAGRYPVRTEGGAKTGDAA
ncbi:MAG: 3'-5' exonuclease [Candidatus Eisenbacteria bacterium]